EVARSRGAPPSFGSSGGEARTGYARGARLRRILVMMRWSNGTVGRTASVISVALAYGMAGCSAGSGQGDTTGTPGAGGGGIVPGAGGASTLPPGSGSTPATYPP